MQEKYRFFKVPFERTGDIEFKELSPHTKNLYYTLCRLAFQYGNSTTGWFFQSIKNLCDESKMNRKTVMEGKKCLLHLDMIEVKRGKRQSSGYRSADCYKINGLRGFTKS
jgi:hypothetical protein